MAHVIARSPFDFATLRSGQAPRRSNILTRLARSWQPVIPGKAAGRAPESRSQSLDSRFRGNDESLPPLAKNLPLKASPQGAPLYISFMVFYACAVLRMEQPQLVLITGPTATGKTALAVELASYYDAEIISADSRQVYRYLDIGTAKPTAAERTAVPHHLLDVVDPDERFDSACFRTLALTAMQNILQRGKRVFVVGGTGLYLRALTRGLCVGPPADPALRAQLQEQEQHEGKGFLHRWLSRVDPDAAVRLHPNDTVRLIRALEVFLQTGTPLSHWQRVHGFRERPFSTLTIGLVLDRETLADRITQRCRQMVDDGLVDEVRGLWQRGYGPELPLLQTIGYAQIGDMLQGRCSLEDALALIAKETRQLAKRQLTWLRAEPEVRWFAPSQEREIAAAIAEFYRHRH